jgi:hypothetical protein
MPLKTFDRTHAARVVKPAMNTGCGLKIRYICTISFENAAANTQMPSETSIYIKIVGDTHHLLIMLQ